MKRKIAIVVMTFICAVICALGFAACSSIYPSTPSHTHSYAWTDNGDGTHSGHCSVSGCDKPDINNELHIWGADNKCKKCTAINLNGGHEHTYSDKWTSTGADGHYHLATCEHTNEHTKVVPHSYDNDEDTTCNDCGYVRTVNYSHEHTFMQEKAESQYLKTAADCTHKAVYYKSCSVCGEKGVDTFEYGEPNGHTFTREEAGTQYLKSEADCTHKAVYYKSCSVCGEKGTDTFKNGNANGHTFTREKAELQYLKSEADCMHKAVYYKSCSVCGEKGTNTFEYGEINANTHALQHHEAKKATCVKQGNIEYWECKDCKHYFLDGNGKTETTEITTQIDPNNHTLVHRDAQAATCTNIGWSAYDFCVKCEYTTYNEIAELGHNFVNKYCERCEEYESGYTFTDGLIYSEIRELDSIVGYSVTGVTSTVKNDYNIVIPKYYKGKSVTGIGEYAFLYCSNLMSITIPESVTNIGKGAFYGCSKLSSITIPDGVTSIGKSAFDGCNGLTSITIPYVGAQKDGDSDTHFGYIFGAYSYNENSRHVPNSLKTVVITICKSIGNNAFNNCNSLTSITLPDTMTSIGRRVFSGCSSLMSITIPDSIESINVGAFSGCNSLINIKIPNSVTMVGGSAFENCIGLASVIIGNSVNVIGRSAFSGCNSLTNISVDVGNTKYHSTENCIIETATKTIVVGCKNSIIPDDGSVTSIGEYAFDTCRNLTSITIPDSVTSIGGGAFSNCNNLMSIKIPNSVTNIGMFALYSCNSLTDITIPFVGDSKDSTSKNYFGYIFGAQYSGSNSEYVPNSLKTVVLTGGYIGNGAFKDCSSLTSITILESVTIDDFAFYNCNNLKSITIHDSLTSIGDWAFSNCSNLKIINYTGSMANWCSISGLDNLMRYGSSDRLLIIDGKEIAGKLIIPDNVTSIGNHAFYNCSQITGIVMSNDVVSIGLQSFADCRSLTSIAMSDGGLSIGNGAFENCSGLTSITIPDSVIRIGGYAFRGCSSLTSIIIPFVGESRDGTSNTNFGALFGSAEYIPLSLKTVVITGGTSIGNGAFENCSSLTSITIPDSVIRIGGYAFRGCSSLTSIEIPNSVTNIGDWAFAKCNSLISIVIPFTGRSKDETIKTHFGYLFGADTYSANSKYIPNSLRSVVIKSDSIKFDAFYECSSLSSVSIGNSVTSISCGAFFGCSGLDNLTVASGNTKYHSDGNCIIETASKTLVVGCKSSIIPTDGSVTSIGNRAFYGCSSITSITIPDSITNITSGAFSCCSGLDNLTVVSGNTKYHSDGNCIIETASKTLVVGCKNSVIPTDGSVTSIGSSAFQGCSSLTSITIPSNVTNIGSHAFSYCGLTSIEIPNGITRINQYMFDGCSDLTSIEISTGVINIEYAAFQHCGGLKSVYYNRAKKYWDRISISGCNDNLTDAIIYCATEGLKYTLNSDGLSYCVSGIDTGSDSDTVETDIVIASKYNDLPVTSIADEAFKQCSWFNSVIIPNSVTRIGNYAFLGCDKITSIEIPNSVSSIGIEAFFSCDNLTILTIGANVADIGEMAFSACNLEILYWNATECKRAGTIESPIFLYSNLSNIIIGDNVITIPDIAFNSCYQLLSVQMGSNVTSIGVMAFRDCINLTSIEIPNSVTNIAYNAFYGCYNLMNIIVDVGNIRYHSADNCLIETETRTLIIGCKNCIIPTDGSVISIGGYAFRGCSGLTSITIPDCVTSVGEYAFNACSDLTSITVGNNVTSIGHYAFYDCSKIEEINYTGDINGWCKITGLNNLMGYGASGKTLIIDGKEIRDEFVILDGVTSIGNYAFYGCSNLTSIIIPNNVTSIGNNVFDGCSGLRSVTIPDSITSIGEHAFNACSSLINLDIGNGVMNIGYGAFAGCSSLTKITIPDSVISIGDRVFDACSSLVSVTIGSNITRIGGWAFRGCNSLSDILVSSKNSKYHSKDNCIIDTESKTLVLGCKNSVIPSDGSVTSIGDYAFYGCGSLISITITNCITSIGNDAFSGCSSLTGIAFNGTMVQWNAISKGSSWDSYIGNYTVTCTDGELDKDGNEITE